MMKNKFLFLLVLGLVFLAGCSDDDEPEWKKIPQEEISAQNIALEINGEKASSGTVQMTVKSESEAVLNMKNVIPGYAEIPVEVTLEKLADNSFAFTGEKGLTTPPAMMTVRSTASVPVILYVKVDGKVSLDGKASVTATTRLAETAQGGLAGSWNLQLTSTTVDNALVAAPLFITWTALDAEKPNMEFAANVVNLFGSAALVNLLNQVTFHEDGNITAKYWSEITMEDIFNGMGDDGSFVVAHDKWLTSSKGLAFWYVKNNMIYIIPNIDAIIAQVNKDNGGENVVKTEDMTVLLEKLGEYGINVEALLPVVMEWASTGVPLKYDAQGSTLKLYVDKEMVAPFMAALLPALEVLQKEVDKILK